MIISTLSEDSMIYEKKRIFFIYKIHLFDTPLTLFPIVCEENDIQIKCCDYTSSSFQVIVSSKKYNHVIFDGLIMKTQCYQDITNGYYDVYGSRDVILFEKNRKNEKELRYLLQFYISIKFVLFVLLFCYCFIKN
jgi:hypothetical protein